MKCITKMQTTDDKPDEAILKQKKSRYKIVKDKTRFEIDDKKNLYILNKKTKVITRKYLPGTMTLEGGTTKGENLIVCVFPFYRVFPKEIIGFRGSFLYRETIMKRIWELYHDFDTIMHNAAFGFKEANIFRFINYLEVTDASINCNSDLYYWLENNYNDIFSMSLINFLTRLNSNYFKDSTRASNLNTFFQFGFSQSTKTAVLKCMEDDLKQILIQKKIQNTYSEEYNPEEYVHTYNKYEYYEILINKYMN